MILTAYFDYMIFYIRLPCESLYFADLWFSTSNGKVVYLLLSFFNLGYKISQINVFYLLYCIHTAVGTTKAINKGI